MNLFIADLETGAAESFLGAPLVWYRYVDYVRSIVKKKHIVEGLLDHLNSQHENINFTVEVENGGQLSFMDVLLHRREDGSINPGVY